MGITMRNANSAETQAFPFSKHRLTVNDFHKMGEAGILGEEARVELIAGIPEVWLIDLQQGGIEIYLRPSPNGYRQILRPERQEQITLSRLPDVKITAADLFIP
jgi:hypothetical protein